MGKLLRLDVTVPSGEGYEEICDRLTGYLSQRLSQGWEEIDASDGSTLFRLHLPKALAGELFIEEFRANFAGLEASQSEIEDENWMEGWKQYFTPLAIGQVFEILPPWLADKASPGREPIIIEPKMAFGTGHHPTTAMCLAKLCELFAIGRIKSGQNFLDLGTGSGILGIGLCKLGLSGLGLDIDPLAIECAQENLELNKVEGLELRVCGLEGLEPGQKFDVVAANILAQPLIDMAPDLASRLAPGGALVLSGILREQASAVAQAYAAQGLSQAVIEYEKEWAVLVFC